MPDSEDSNSGPQPPERRASIADTHESVSRENSLSFDKPLPTTPQTQRKKKAKDILGRKSSFKSVKKISTPTNVKHVVHVVNDPITGKLYGLPKEWQQRLDLANISEEEQSKNPDAVVTALQVVFEEKTEKFITGVEEGDYDDLPDGPPRPVDDVYGSMELPPPLPTKLSRKEPTDSFEDYASPRGGLCDIRESREVSTFQRDDEADAPAIPARPERTMSVYTRPVENQTDGSPKVGPAPAPKPGGNATKKIDKQEVMNKLRTVVDFGDPKKKYDLRQQIGQGASGQVHLATDRSTGETVAIKMMIIDAQPRPELILTEINVMKRTRHPNIVNYIGSYLVDNATSLWFFYGCHQDNISSSLVQPST
ncbi:serine/threonine-protein kinase Pak [Hyalella azteca]|uniref:non-specific serine/threonine protein kinase n=1 Tax=Hyalella azteca TaxID=294128 RepID=A0A8B7NLZ0_HYAAZ|nr:serine/threonine-protein kinase Pak [Hyalella azteca]